MTTLPYFFNQCLDKGRLKRMILWSLAYQGEYKTIQLIENLKTLGFQYATYAGVSLSIDDLSIPPKKKTEVIDSEVFVFQSTQGAFQGNRTAIEGLQSVIDTWHRTSETVKQHVIDYFEATNILNPVYMMAFSGARGNVSQVRQLVGMRGLMADAQGNIIGFPIRSNFREGLTVTEYMISCYGARKGVVDTALRTADAGYLTRRLVDVAQHVVIQKGSCGTKRGVFIAPLEEHGQVVLQLNERLIGRVLATDVLQGDLIIAERNQAISEKLALKLDQLTTHAKKEGHEFKVHVRSPLTCELPGGICQLCYGWSLSQNSMVTLGEAVGVIAGQSIGEPGTQLTMRTFHTGGVFTGDVQEEFRSPHKGIVTFPNPFQGLLIRTTYGQIAFLVKASGVLLVTDLQTKTQTRLTVPIHTALFVREGEYVRENQLLGQFGGIGSQRNERLETKKIVFSKLDGQVVSQNVAFKQTNVSEKHATPTKGRYQVTNALGTVWVLSGKRIGSTKNLLRMYRSSGHLVNPTTVINRHSLLGSWEGFVRPMPTIGVWRPEIGTSLLTANTRLQRTIFSSTQRGDLKKALQIPMFTSLLTGVYENIAFGCTFGRTFQGDTLVWSLNAIRMFKMLGMSTQRQLPLTMSLHHTLQPKIGPSALECTLLYVPAYYKTQTGGSFWLKSFYSSPSRKHGLVFWKSRIQTNLAPMASAFVNHLTWKSRSSWPLPCLPMTTVTYAGTTWLRPGQPLCTAMTLQSAERPVATQRYGILQYRFTRLVADGVPHVTGLPKTVKPNPLAACNSSVPQHALLASLFQAAQGTSLSLKTAFPFSVQQSRICRAQLSVVQNWCYFAPATAFNFGMSALTSPSFNYQTTSSSMLLNSAQGVHYSCYDVERSNRRCRHIFGSYHSVSGMQSSGVAEEFLPSLRNAFCLRHPAFVTSLRRQGLRQPLLAEALMCAKRFRVFTHSIAPGFPLLRPSVLSLGARYAPSTLFDAQFTGWLYVADRAPISGDWARLFRICSSTARNFQALIRETFLIAQTPIREYSLDFSKSVRAQLIRGEAFEGAANLLKSWARRTPIWVKQASTKLIPAQNRYRVRHHPVFVSTRYDFYGSTCFFRVLVQMSLQGMRTFPESSFGTLLDASSLTSTQWTYGIKQALPKDTCDDKVLGPINSMYLPGEPVLARLQRVKAAGESFSTPDQDVILLRAKDTESFSIKDLPQEQFLVSVGQTVRFGDEIIPGVAIPASGQILSITRSQLFIRKGQPVLFYKSASLHVQHNQWISLGHPLVTLSYQRLVTGDIVQGIPKVEQVFEASQSRDVEVNLQHLLRDTFRSLKNEMPLSVAIRKSIGLVQRQIIDRIQSIYLSQGVGIDDKHFEIIVRQMTSKVRVLDPGDTGLFRSEIIPLIRAENVNAGTWDRKARYEPIICGISASALTSESFLSAASFQETTRILTRDSILRKTDFLRGLKERVILGDIIPAGTGLGEMIAYRKISPTA